MSQAVRLVLALLIAAGLSGIDPAGGAAAQTAAPDCSTTICPIGTVQGAVGAGAGGPTHRSPYAPASGNGAGTTDVTIQGVIYQKTLARTSSGGSNYGFFIQNTAATADADPATSDGLFVFHSTFTTLRRLDGTLYTPRVGDEVILRGRVVEFFSLTQLSNPRLVQLVRAGVDLAAELPAAEAAPPDDLTEAGRYWERHEGMRLRVPANSTVLGGRNVFPSTADGEVWVARPDSTIAQRVDPYTRRAFRDPHPLDNQPQPLFDDGNGYRIVLGSLGIKAAANDNTALIAPARTFDRLQGAPDGGLYFSFGKYQIMIGQQLQLAAGPDPSRNAPPAAFDRAHEYSLATFNVENLYDHRDDPFDGCDAAGNAGCPGVRPPFDYVPASQAAYEARLEELARQIVGDLHSPDIILVQEAEDQDICLVTLGALVCGTTDDADGKPDTLQELTTAVARRGGPTYQAVYDRDGADDRGIVSAFLYRTDRVELLPASATDPVLGATPAVSYRGAALPYNGDIQNPKALNAALPSDVDRSTGTDGSDVFTRAPQVGRFRVWRDAMGASVFVDLYVISNHFSSGPETRVGQRREQAAYNAAIAAALQAADPAARVVAGGDLNVFPRPDDPFRPGQVGYPSDQLAPLYNQGLTNLWDVLAAEAPASAYSYVFQGQAQTLDHLFVTTSQRAELVTMRAAHINADWPADDEGDGPRGTSDHDPQVARFSALPTFAKMAALVRYFAESGGLTGDGTDQTARLLLERLERAAHYAASGQQAACDAQIQAFINQVQGLDRSAITPAAAAALTTEAGLLAGC